MSDAGSIYNQVQIGAVISETADTKTFELLPLHNWQADYAAGQFITLVFVNNNKEDRRSYSFSSAPVLQEPMRITVKRMANGEYSRQLVDHAKEGDILTTSGIAGYFRLPADYDKVSQLCFLAAGSGITPVFSLLKTVLESTLLPVYLVYSNHSEKDTIFHRELVHLQRQYSSRFTIEFLYSRKWHTHKRRLSKPLLNELLAARGTPLQHTLFYLCGPANYMLMAEITLISAGVPKENIRKENFNTRKPVIKPAPPDVNAHQVKLSINNQNYEFTVQYPDTILASAKKLNIHLPYSCEAGNCGSCTATCVSGKTWMAYNEVLTDSEIAKGKVLTCQGYPVSGDIVIHY